MKIAISVYGNTVSNVFDFARRLLLVEVEGGREIDRCEVDVGNRSLPQRADWLRTLGVDVLICGAISRVSAHWIEAAGIEVLAYVTGPVEGVLEAYLSGRLVRPEFRMPGCWPGARKGFGRRRHQCRWRGGPP